MAGGIGSRFWPSSREGMPKQFLDILNIGKSLLVMTYERFSKICPEKNIFIVTNEKYRDIIKEQIPTIEDNQILGEPYGKNTAPCIAYATYKIAQIDPDANCIVAPSDHAIFNESEFENVINKSIEFSGQGEKLVTIGITPHKPETGYGYIQYIDDSEVFKKVKTFTEKPNLDLAQKFLESGDFVWNAGIFIWNVKTIQSAFEKYLPDLSEIFSEINEFYNTDKEKQHVDIAYSQCKQVSIDYGIMEKASNVYVIPAEFGWSDLGSWASLHEISEKDENNNLIKANAITFETKDCIIKASDKTLVVVEGLEGYLVVEHENAILICKKDNERQFRQIYSEVKKKKGPEYL